MRHMQLRARRAKRIRRLAYLFLIATSACLVASMFLVPRAGGMTKPVVMNHLEPSKDVFMVIEVKDGETYKMAEARVKKEIWNKANHVTEPSKKVVQLPKPNRTSSELLPVASKVCVKVGLPTDPCARDLVAMAWKESRFVATAVGDNSRSFGFFQIQLKLHKITKECATNFECAAEWTAKHLIKNGYPRLRSVSIARHNGGGDAAKRYAESVKAYSLAMVK